MTETTLDTSDPAAAMPEKLPGRRGFLAMTGVGGLGLLAAACGDSASSSSSSVAGPVPSSSPGSISRANDDVAHVLLVASLEALAVSTYKAALDAATGGRLGTVPPAVTALVQTAMAHHQTALDKANRNVTRDGLPAVSAPPADLAATVDAALAKVADVAGTAKVALFIEQTLADTYLKLLPSIQIKPAVTEVGALQCVAQEHAAILLYVLGQYPVPDVFQKGDKAYTPPARSATTSASASS